MTHALVGVVLPWNMGSRSPAAAPRVRIERWDARRDGPLTRPALRRKLETFDCEGTERVYPAGAVVRASSEPKLWLQAVVRGLVKVTIDGERALLGPGDMAFVPAGAIRRVEAVGDSAVHCLEAVAEAA